MQFAVSFLLKSLVMSAIILVFLAFSAIFMKDFRANLRYAVWIVVLVGLLVPTISILGGGFIAVPLPAATQTYLADSETVSGVYEGMAVNAASTPFGQDVSPLMACFLVWGVVAALIIAYQIWRYFRFLRLIRRWGEPVQDENILSVFQAIQEEKGLRGKKIKIVFCDFVSSSLLTGFVRPVIVLPKKHFETDELEYIFRHELVHYKRHDLFVKLLSVIAVSIHWFNPVVYWMYAAMQADGEASCDEIVLKNIGDENRQFYAELMIKMTGGKNAATMLSTCFYGRRKSIKRRLDAILDTSKKITRPAYAAFALFTILTVFSGSVFAFTARSPALPQTIPERVHGGLELARGIAGAGAHESLERAREIALAAVGGGIVGRTETLYHKDGGIRHYKVLIVHNGYKYDVDVDASDGAIKKMNASRITTTDAHMYDAADTLHTDRVAAIAVEAAGGGVVTKCGLEHKPREGTLFYHVHVARGEWEYCMEIAPDTGAIRSCKQRYKP